MRIAQIAPLFERVPPKKYGGTERVVHTLTEELVKRGHDVTLFASGDSLTSAKLVSVYPKGLRESHFDNVQTTSVYSLLNIGTAYNCQDDFDIIHDHTGYLGLITANMAHVPTVFTMHGPFTLENRALYQEFNKPGIVTISQAQRRYVTNINHVGTIYNGLSMESYPFSDTPDDYLLFVGRISPEKGVHLAIETAVKTGRRLIIAAKLDPRNSHYFQSEVEPFLSDQIQWIGEVEEDQRNNIMSNASAFLHPITWHEPFGLTLIEAMACGTPVIAIGKGSIPEIVVDGKTGFVVENVEQMIDAVGKIKNIRRQDCRDHALHNFSTEKMVSAYEDLYEQMIAEYPEKKTLSKNENPE